MHCTLNIFGPSATAIEVFGYHLTIQSLTSRKRCAPKTSGCGIANIPPIAWDTTGDQSPVVSVSHLKSILLQNPMNLM